MKAYITCPASYTQNRLDILPVVKNIVEEAGIKPFVFEIGGDSKEIFSRDYSNLASSNILIAEVSERSHGVGIELGLSYGLGLKRILLLASAKKIRHNFSNSLVTRFVKMHTIARINSGTCRINQLYASPLS